MAKAKNKKKGKKKDNLTNGEVQIVPGISPEIVSHCVTAASFTASNLVYEYAQNFKSARAYRPLEDLAANVQQTVVEAFMNYMKEQGVDVFDTSDDENGEKEPDE